MLVIYRLDLRIEKEIDRLKQTNKGYMGYLPGLVSFLSNTGAIEMSVLY